MNKIVKTLCAVVVLPLGLSLALAATGCAGNKNAANSATGSTTSPVAALAAKVGIPEPLVTMALQAAQGLLAQKAQPAATVAGAPPSGVAPTITADDKAAAAQQGVETAASHAQSQGKPIPDAKKFELLEGLTGLL